MNLAQTYRTTTVKIILAAAVTLLTLGSITSTAKAASVTSTTPAVGNVALAKDGTFKLTITTDNDPAIAEIEVDHSLETTVPEFSLCADQAQPYCTAGDQQQFEAAGASVTYGAGVWEIDFGQTLTSQILNNGGITFYLALRDADGDYLWGSMSPTTPENTFAFTVTESDEVTTPVDEDENETDDTTPSAEVTVPGVPNTATATDNTVTAILSGAGAIGVGAALYLAVRRK